MVCGVLTVAVVSLACPPNDKTDFTDKTWRGPGNVSFVGFVGRSLLGLVALCRQNRRVYAEPARRSPALLADCRFYRADHVAFFQQCERGI